MPVMSHMRCLVLILFLLVVTAALSGSQLPAGLNGSEGSNLSNNLTESSLNRTNASLNATEYSVNVNGIKSTSSDLWSWGSKPKYNSSDNAETDYLSDPAFNL
jgi:hypothetical protein